MNSTIESGGRAFTREEPDYANKLGMDLDVFTNPGALANDQTSARWPSPPPTSTSCPRRFFLVSDEGPATSSGPPSVAPGDRRHGAGRPDADRRPRHLDRHARPPTPTSGSAATPTAPTAPTSPAPPSTTYTPPPPTSAHRPRRRHRDQRRRQSTPAPPPPTARRRPRRRSTPRRPVTGPAAQRPDADRRRPAPGPAPARHYDLPVAALRRRRHQLRDIAGATGTTLHAERRRRRPHHPRRRHRDQRRRHAAPPRRRSPSSPRRPAEHGAPGRRRHRATARRSPPITGTWTGTPDHLRLPVAALRRRRRQLRRHRRRDRRTPTCSARRRRPHAARRRHRDEHAGGTTTTTAQTAPWWHRTGRRGTSAGSPAASSARRAASSSSAAPSTRRVALLGIGTVRVRAYTSGPALRSSPLRLTTESPAAAPERALPLRRPRHRAPRGRAIRRRSPRPSSARSGSTRSNVRARPPRHDRDVVADARDRALPDPLHGPALADDRGRRPAPAHRRAHRARPAVLRRPGRAAAPAVRQAPHRRLHPPFRRRRRQAGALPAHPPRPRRAGDDARRQGAPTATLRRGGLSIAGLPARSAVAEVTLYRVTKLDRATSPRAYTVKVAVHARGRQAADAPARSPRRRALGWPGAPACRRARARRDRGPLGRGVLVGVMADTAGAGGRRSCRRARGGP